MWYAFNDGKTLGTRGSEGGIILLDEAYNRRCRITLEKTDRGYAITCGDYSGMCHTAFANEQNHMIKYNAMKTDLAAFINMDIDYPECCRFYDEFTNRY